MIYEDILHFSNTKGTTKYNSNQISDMAREIAVEMLLSKREQINMNKSLLNEAIYKSLDVKESILI